MNDTESSNNFSYEDGSVEADVMAAYEELKAQHADEGEDDGDRDAIAAANRTFDELEDDGTQKGGDPKTEEEPSTPEPVQAEKIAPPQSWSVEEKEWFNSQPVEAQKAFAKRNKDLEAHSFKVWEEAAAAKRQAAEEQNEIRDILETLAPYERKWGLQGVSRASMLKSLAESQQLLNENPEAGLDMIAQSYGMSLEQIVLDRMNRGDFDPSAYQPAPVEDSRLLELQNTVQLLQNELYASKQAVVDQKTSENLAQLHAVRDETDTNGRYLRPELHDESFVTGLMPVYQGLIQSNPTMTPREALARAYSAVTGKSVSQPQSRAQSMGSPQAAKTSNLSIRSGTRSPSVSTSSGPDNETPEDTVFRIAREYGVI